jgi:N-acyl homoserine lactone hydrolase
MSTDYSVWAFRYARSSMPRDFFGGTPVFSNQGKIGNPMAYSAIMGGPTGDKPRPIVIDTGIRDAFSLTGKKYKCIEMPKTVLRKVGLKPEEIETVILTHLHFDHAGNMDAYPNATFHVQRREYEGWLRAFDEFKEMGTERSAWPMSSMEIKDFENFERLKSAGRVKLLDGDAEIAPGVTCRLAADTHTFGSQWVEVETASGPYVLAGDAVYWYANIERMWPPGYVQGNTWNIMATYLHLKKFLKGQINRIVPGHDPEIFTRHPTWMSGKNPVAELHVANSVGPRRPQARTPTAE